MNKHVDKYLETVETVVKPHSKVEEFTFFATMTFGLVLMFPFFLIGWVKSKFSK